jgi:hypothetical protein
MFTQSFRPALNKEGYSKLTFIGCETKEGTKEDGTPWSMFNINFLVKGAIKGTDKIIPVTTGFNYDPDNLLGTTLAKLGFVEPEIEMTNDDDGFEESVSEQDEDGFYEDPDRQLNITEFLSSIEGNIYIGKISKMTEGKRKGFWVIDVNSIQFFKPGEKKEEKKEEKTENAVTKARKTKAKVGVENNQN